MSQVVVPRWIIVVGSIVVLLGVMVFLAALVVGYIGDEYVTPAFSESSIPPPGR